MIQRIERLTMLRFDFAELPSGICCVVSKSPCVANTNSAADRWRLCSWWLVGRRLCRLLYLRCRIGGRWSRWLLCSGGRIGVNRRSLRSVAVFHFFACFLGPLFADL